MKGPAQLPPKGPNVTQQQEIIPQKVVMIIKVKKETNEGQEKTQEVKFEFDLNKDTIYGVATEMVGELELGEHQIAEI